jgi:predicted enzyme related to lactoylglutathione lyase
MDLKLEVVVIPVSDVDRAKAFYEKLGFRLDIDYARDDDHRLVQLTPRGSEASIHIGKGITSAAPGSVRNLYLVVSDIEKARADLVDRGIEVSEVFHHDGLLGSRVVSKHIADDLAQYPQWHSHLHELGECEVKHGVRTHAFNLYTDELGNPTTPKKFKDAQRIISAN